MKKINMMMIVAAAAMVAACSDTTTKLNNDFSRNNQTEKIGFSTFSEKATRAAETNSVNLYDFYKTFDVYAWKTVATDTQSVFHHVPVEYFTEDTIGQYVYTADGARPSDEWGINWKTEDRFHSWFYEDIRYWDKLADSYNFYAIAPFETNPTPALHIENGQSNIKIGASDDRYKVSTEKNLAINPTITNEKRYFGFKKDYMLADKFGTKFQLVSLDFHHILTKLNVKITLSENYIGSQTFTIKDLKIARLEDDAYFEFAGMTNNGWHTDSNSIYDIEIPEDYILKNVPANAADTIEYSGYYWIQTLVFPQTLTCKATGPKIEVPEGKYLYIEYTIGDETFKAYYDLAYVFNNTITENGTYELEQGSEYTINILVGPELIVFDAKATKWALEEETITHNIN